MILWNIHSRQNFPFHVSVNGHKELSAYSDESKTKYLFFLSQRTTQFCEPIYSETSLSVNKKKYEIIALKLNNYIFRVFSKMKIFHFREAVFLDVHNVARKIESIEKWIVCEFTFLQQRSLSLLFFSGAIELQKFLYVQSERKRANGR